MPTPQDKRREPRFVLRKPLVVTWQTDMGTGSGTVSNMSKRGCYVLTQKPLATGERFRVSLDSINIPEIECEARYVDEHVGMGVKFFDPAQEIVDKIEAFLRVKAVTA